MANSEPHPGEINPLLLPAHPLRDSKVNYRAILKAPIHADKLQLIDVKDGRLLLRQAPIYIEKTAEAMQDIVNFQQMLQERIELNLSCLEHFPDSHLPMVAKLVHESDKTIQSLTKHISQLLQPAEFGAFPQTEDSSSRAFHISPSAIELAIKSVAERINYGVQSPSKPPAPLCIWRWEVLPGQRDWLPKFGRDKLERRILERREAREELMRFIANLSESEKQAFLNPSRKEAQPTKTPEQIHPTSGSNNENMPMTPAPRKPGRPSKDRGRVDTTAAKGKSEKQIARAEKERKEQEAQSKSRSMLSAFLIKPKPQKSPHSDTCSSASNSKLTIDSLADSTNTSDFAKTFKTFVLRKDVSLAPINGFLEYHITQANADSCGDASAHEILPNPQSTLRQLTKDLTREYGHSKGARPNLLKPRNATKCVRSIMADLTEAEVAGDTIAVRRLTKLLENRETLPAKVFIFHENTRPGYFGTFTRASNIINPRRPLKKDSVALDYSYDSGEEWEQEDGDADDVTSLNGSVDGEEASVDSDMDSWLVDDDAVEEPGTPISERAVSPSLFLKPPTPKRRIPGNSAGAKEIKKRKVIPLVPFNKGPVWEDELGHCDYELFRSYQIQTFNEISFPIDPFQTIVEQVPTGPASRSTGDQVIVSGSTQMHAPQAVPSNPQASYLNTGNQVLSLIAKRKVPLLPPKTSIPDALIPLLLDKITQLQTGNFTWLVDSIFHELKQHSVKKNAIEAKVREVGEKCASKRIWVVKPALTATRQPAEL